VPAILTPVKTSFSKVNTTDGGADVSGMTVRIFLLALALAWISLRILVVIDDLK
jgi:hypothetical protein